MVKGPNFTEMDDNGDFHNLSVVGGGAVVYAADLGDSSRLPNLWKTIDGGDGSLSTAALASRISLDHHLEQGNSACDTSNLNIFFQNLSCNYALLKHFTIEGLDSTQYLSQWRHHLACDDIPDSLLVKIFPFYPGFGTFTFHGQFMNDEYQIIDTSFAFTLLSRPGEFAGIYLKSLPLGRKAGDTIEIPIYINSTQSPAQTGTISVTLTYFLNTNLLTPLEFIPISGVIADPVQTTKTTATVTLHFDQGFTFSGETELGRLRCVAYVTDTLETDIILNAHSSGCLATLADSNVTHFTLTGCGATTLSNFMKFGTAYNILSIIPNPANNSVLIMLKNNGSLLNYELLNPLGLVQKTGTTTGSKLQINLSGLSSGNYYFRLSGEGGIPVTEKLVIMK
jgi:hypothetical protein